MLFASVFPPCMGLTRAWLLQSNVKLNRTHDASSASVRINTPEPQRECADRMVRWWQVGSLGKGEVVEATETRGPDAAGVTRVQFKRVKCAPTLSSSWFVVC